MRYNFNVLKYRGWVEISNTCSVGWFWCSCCISLPLSIKHIRILNRFLNSPKLRISVNNPVNIVNRQKLRIYMNLPLTIICRKFQDIFTCKLSYFEYLNNNCKRNSFTSSIRKNLSKQKLIIWKYQNSQTLRISNFEKYEIFGKISILRIPDQMLMDKKSALKYSKIFPKMCIH